MYCTYCGSTLTTHQRFCGKCGTPVNPKDQSGPGHSPNSISSPVHFTTGPDFDKDLALFVGKNSATYMKKWKNSTEWNWAAFFFDFYWLLYRKMYLYGFLGTIFVGIWAFFLTLLFTSLDSDTSMVLEALLTPICILIYKIAAGLLANKLYLHQAKRKIAALNAYKLEDRIRESAIAKRGGTNLPLVLVFLIGPYLLSFLLGAALYLFYANTTLEDASSSRLLAPFAVHTPAARTPAAQTPDDQEAVPDEATDSERVNILLIGDDAAGIVELSLADSLMVVSLDPVEQQINLISILRDTYVEEPGVYQGSIGDALSLNDTDFLMQKAEELTGLSIPYYIYTNMDGFTAIIDEMGGVDLDVEKNMNAADPYDPAYDIHLKKGYQHLDGSAALQYVRYSQKDLGDIARTERQRILLHALCEQMKTKITVKDLPGLVRTFETYIGSNIGVSGLLYLAQVGLDVDPDRFVGTYVPQLYNLEERTVNNKPVLMVRYPEDLKTYVQMVMEQDYAGTLY